MSIGPRLFSIVFLLGGACLAAPEDHPVAVPPDPAGSFAGSVGRRDLTKEWGVEIQGIRLTAAGYMLDFRYKVTDGEKAAPIFLRKNHPVLTDQASGRKFVVSTPATVGPLRSSDPPQEGRTYFMLFSNPGGYVKEGSRVTIQVGEFQLKDLEVQ